MKDTDHPFVSAAVLVLIAYLIRQGLSPLLGHRSPWLLFMVAIVVAAGRYGVRPGVLAMALSFMLGLIAFVENVDQATAETVTGLAVFLVVGAAMLIFAAHLKATQQRAIQLLAELHQAHTASALGTMAAILAHELNQPLAAASNYAAASRRLLERASSPPEGKVLVAIANAEGQIQRAGEIIRHARDLVRNVGVEREPASLQAMVGRVKLVLRADGNHERATIRTEIEPEADDVVANPIQIEQVLMNLLRNACQAADGSAEVLVKATAADSVAIVEVWDHGPGIDEDRLPELFSGQRQSTQGGLGLGLSISRMIVEAHGGRIWAENHGDGGVSFFFTVPRTGR